MFSLIKEGNVKIKTEVVKEPTKKMKVFFNVTRDFERTLNIALLNAYFTKSFNAIDLLSATGIRGLRIAKETKASSVILNDISKDAFELIKENILLNELNNTIAFNEDANKLLHLLDYKFSYIDIDPFGSPLKFIDSAIRYCKRNGLIAITATDTANLFGIKREKCKRLYLANNFFVPFFREIGTRILIKRVIEIGSKYEVALVPIFSFALKHFVRIYFRKVCKRKEVDKLISNFKYIFYCKDTLERKIENFGKNKNYIGPIFAGEINDKKLIQRMIKEVEKMDYINEKNKEKMVKFLEIAKNELDTPFYYETWEIAKKLKKSELKVRSFVNYLSSAGIKASLTIFSSKGFKAQIPTKELIKEYDKVSI